MIAGGGIGKIERLTERFSNFSCKQSERGKLRPSLPVSFGEVFFDGNAVGKDEDLLVLFHAEVDPEDVF